MSEMTIRGANYGISVFLNGKMLEEGGGKGEGERKEGKGEREDDFGVAKGMFKQHVYELTSFL